MLEQILDYIHNYFEKDVVTGKYTISSGTIELDFLKCGQYFRICGSTFNDGVYQYPTVDLVDETFCGAVWAMAVPPAVIALSTEVDEWLDRYGKDTESPYQSESFGGYSYSKASGSSGNGNIGWKDVFRDRLNRWRKI